jgi:hypothetical protein
MKRLITICLVSVAVVSLAFAPAASADVIFAQTNFGNTPGTDVTPFSTDYKPGFTVGAPIPGEYQVAISAAVFGPSDWGGSDHTAPGTGCFMVIDGSMNSGNRIVYFTINTVAGYDYTLNGWVQNILSGSGSPPELSFCVNDSQLDTFTPAGNQTWCEFTFIYTAVASGLSTFALHDNNTSYGANDLGIDDLTLSSTVPEPATICLLGLGGLLLGRNRKFNKKRK